MDLGGRHRPDRRLRRGAVRGGQPAASDATGAGNASGDPRGGLARAVAGDQTGAYELQDAILPVRIRPRFEGGIERGADEVIVRASRGDVLAAVSVADVTLSRARATFRARVLALMIVVVVGVLLLATGPLLDWRRLTRHRAADVLITMGVVAILLISRVVAGIAIDWAALQAPRGGDSGRPASCKNAPRPSGYSAASPKSPSRLRHTEWMWLAGLPAGSDWMLTSSNTNVGPSTR